MRAVMCREFGSPQALVVEEVEAPRAGRGQIVVTVKACGVNFPDTLIIRGLYQFKPPLPFSPGSEVAGIVKEVGPGVETVKPGDRVIAFGAFGGFAEEMLAEAGGVIPMPAAMDFETAASIVMTYGTSLHALKDRAQLRPGETVLVLGAAGGIGLAAVELGKVLGARVIAAASSDDKLAICRQHGADAVINYGTEDLKDRINALTERQGVDVIVDPVGGPYSEPALRGMAWNGRFLVIGFTAGDIPRIPLNLPLLKGCSIAGVFWGSFAARHPRHNHQNLRELLGWFEAGKLRSRIAARYPLEGAGDALSDLLQRRVMGKAVLVVQASPPTIHDPKHMSNQPGEGTMTIDETKLNAFMGKVVGDLGATMSSALIVLGDRLGLYRAMAATGPVTATQLARRTETAERYVGEWLNAQAAAGYVTYDATSGRYALPPEQAFALADDDSPAAVAGAFSVARAMWSALDRMEANFRTGGGLEWGHQHPCLFEGTERFFRAGYIGNLIGSWIPALDGVQAKLAAGAKVADVGCGYGASTILMAKAFPKSTFRGFDSHQASIDTATRRAKEAGVADRVTFSVAQATDFPGTGYDLVAHFDCLHDMEDPAGAARHARRTLAMDGTWLIVEPFSSDKPEENHNAVGRIYYSASTLLCVPHSLAHQGPALGAQAGEARLRDLVVAQGGFSRFRRAAETPFNLILEARP